MTLLQQIDRDRQTRREQLRLETRRQLETSLTALLPGMKVVVFGSLLKPGKFSETSDIDLAIADEPADVSLYQQGYAKGKSNPQSPDFRCFLQVVRNPGLDRSMSGAFVENGC